ncbi:MAG: biopolymer transporter ExbD [Myxococcota bacterium]
MRSRRLKEEEENAIDITPMIDIVFIMLIFFVVTASFIKESGVDVRRPDAVSSQKKERASILIGIDDTDKVWIDKKPVDVRAVRANIERLRAENPEGSVVIQADIDSKKGVLAKVMDAAKAAGVQDVSLAATPKE